MEVVSPTEENSHTAKISSPKQSTLEQKHEPTFENVKNQAVETPCGNMIKNSSTLPRNENRLASKSMKKKYTLRSSPGSTRVLRSRVQSTSKAPDPVNSSANIITDRDKKRKKRRRAKKALDDEYSRIRKRLKYLLHRTNFERNLIDAYSGEGWRGQSAEKIKPEKELERATSEILRCKLKIRDLFKHLDTLCAEGRFPESLFDSEGQISSDDIFCAKCGSQDLSADNDIILCDGTCVRGFHQMCLEPPLMKEEIPPGDEGWLCPGCDCKVDCLDLVNDHLGTDLSIDDGWKKVFPEVAAQAAGDKLEDNFGFPSDDSEDNDYDPDGPEVDKKVQTDGSSSDKSDFTSASDDSEDPPREEQTLGLPSDDSEDDDFDPDAPDADENVRKESSSSDFTSDSGDSGPLGDGNESSGTDEVPVSSSVDGTAPLISAGHRRSTKAKQKKQTINSELLSILEPDPSLRNVSPVSGKRHREQLDYKKLHDETYGNGPSDSSDDEDWTDAGGWGKSKKGGTGNEPVLSPKGNSRTMRSGENTGDTSESRKRRTRLALDFGVADKSVSDTHKYGLEPDSIGTGGTSSASTRLGKAGSQKLLESFGDNAYPSRETKEKLAKELGIAFQQVGKWFDHRRWKLRLSAKVEASGVETDSPSNLIELSGTVGKSLELEPKNLVNSGASIGKRGPNSGKRIIVLALAAPQNGDLGRRKCMIGKITPQKSESPVVRNKESVFSPEEISRTASSGATTGDTLQKFKQMGNSQKTRTSLTLDCGGADKSASDTVKDTQETDSIQKGGTKSSYRTPGKAGTQRLLQSFVDNAYPTQETKEKLAEELGITLQQVSKWFYHRRWKSRLSTKVEASGMQTASPSKENGSARTNGKSLELEPNFFANNGASNGEHGTNTGKTSIVLALASPSKVDVMERSKSMIGEHKPTSSGLNKEGSVSRESTPQKSTSQVPINRENGKVDDMALAVAVCNDETPVKCTPTDSPSSQTLAVAVCNDETPVKCTPTDSPSSQTLRRSGRVRSQTKK